MKTVPLNMHLKKYFFHSRSLCSWRYPIEFLQVHVYISSVCIFNFFAGWFLLLQLSHVSIYFGYYYTRVFPYTLFNFDETFYLLSFIELLQITTTTTTRQKKEEFALISR